jgi:hypothetical protein
MSAETPQLARLFESIAAVMELDRGRQRPAFVTAG